jgi:hypothetical protein
MSRHLLDGGVTLLMLVLAVLNGYAILNPTVLLAAAGPGPDALAVASLAPAPPRAAPEAEPPKAPEPPAPITGVVRDAEGRPLPGASIVVDGVERDADAEGAFRLEDVAVGTTLLVKVPGYAKALVTAAREPLEVRLTPQPIKAAYLSYFGVGDPAIRGRVLDLAARTELNAVVIDVKGDRGWVLWPSEVALAREAGAQGPGTLRDVDALMQDLKARGLYTIARVVTFKDPVLAAHRPDLAVLDARTRRPWVDNERLAWTDPFREEVWAYNLAIAREAVARGFDEVQFDYVRFPTDGRLSTARYSRPNTRETRLPAIVGFLERARRELGAAGAFVAADIFGYTAFNGNDTDIGQRVEELAPHLDIVSPMVYPSGYHRGIPGLRNPVENPYRIVFESVRLIRKRAAGTRVVVRPWLQDFRDYAFDRRAFGVPEVRAQMRGAGEAGATGWMLWNSRNEYTGAALAPKGGVAAR